MKPCIFSGLFAVGVDAAATLSKAEIVVRIVYYTGALLILYLTYRRNGRKKK